jgi:hypothetical protein
MRRPIRRCSGWIPSGELTWVRSGEWRVELGIFSPNKRASVDGAEADWWAAPATGAHVAVAHRGHPSGSG